MKVSVTGKACNALHLVCKVMLQIKIIVYKINTKCKDYSNTKMLNPFQMHLLAELAVDIISTPNMLNLVALSWSRSDTSTHMVLKPNMIEDRMRTPTHLGRWISCKMPSIVNPTETRKCKWN